MDNAKGKLIARLFPDRLIPPEELETKYPKRNLPEGAMVTRVAPSPTGSVHFGGLYASLISERLAHQSQGVFILRIEDTDKKREIEGAAGLFSAALERYGILFDEGPDKTGKEKGEYGPYKQSDRSTLYHSYIKLLLEKDLAYPCFATPEELEELRSRQEALGQRSGYYGEFAVWRHKSPEEALEALDKGLKPVIRFRSPGDFNRKIRIEDLLLGKREMPENDQDIVIMKTDGLPTYHFAHAIDDHLMRTTHVIRGNEWFPSLPLHLQLFDALGFARPAYAHLAPIQKMEEGKKRKLSKRKDPEADINFYRQAGYPEEAVIEYLLNLANSNFEDWRRENGEKDNREFQLSFKKLANSSGPLFDLTKLADISKDIVARLDAETLFVRILAWAKEFDLELAEMLMRDKEYAIKILDIERSGVDKPRKDIGRFADAKDQISYFYDDKFILSPEIRKEAEEGLNGADGYAAISEFMAAYDGNEDPTIWFDKLKIIGGKHGFSPSPAELKAHPEKYQTGVGSLAKLIRVLLTGRTQTPNLCYIMRVMGRDRIENRLK
ncbi:MAG: glutamate--tRNA ligase [Bacillota bacterium]